MNDAVNPIPLVTRDDPAAHSGDVVAENIAALKALFPSIVTDGKIDLGVLGQLLGDEVEEGDERYGLNWKGKKRARAFALTPSLGTLRPIKEDGLDWGTTENVVIEGDNLEVLKLLRKSYAGRVKMIYIDPPYNTGSDFVYPDDYRDSIGNYERLTGQRNAEGVRMTSDREAAGRLHTTWLNMIYPRIILAKELLSQDGILFISIGKDELETLTSATVELFGKANHMGTIAWKARAKPVNIGDAKYKPQNENEFVLVFQKSASAGSFEPLFTGGERSYPHAFGERKYRLQTILKSNRGANRRDTMTFSIGNYSPPEGQRWQAGEDEILRLQQDGYLEFRDGTPFRRYFQDEEGAEHDPFYCFMENDWSGTSEGGKAVVNALLGDDHGFDTIKPVRLLQTLVQAATRQHDSIVLDFFGGSGTTAHAVMLQNATDGGSRRFVLVQLPEPLATDTKEQRTAAEFCDKLGKPRNIAELMKERLRRAGTKVQEDHDEAEVDTGFRVYRLATSNLKPWQPHPDNLEASLLDAVDNVLPGRTEDDLLAELLLKTGIDLTLPGETRIIAGKTVHALGGGVLIVCLADIAEAEAEALGQGICDWRDELDPPRATTFYFKDSGFGTAATKANLAAIIRQRLGKAGVEKLASI